MRELDTFGRILIPKEIRKELNINEGDKFIYKILLKMYYLILWYMGKIVNSHNNQ